MSDPTKINKLDGYMTTNCALEAIGPMAIQTPRGLVDCDEVPGLSSLIITKGVGNDPVSVALLTYCPVKGQGQIVQIDADSARNFGASLIRLAAMLDGGVVQ
jgi:hypothetical protein